MVEAGRTPNGSIRRARSDESIEHGHPLANTIRSELAGSTKTYEKPAKATAPGAVDMDIGHIAGIRASRASLR